MIYLASVHFCLVTPSILNYKLLQFSWRLQTFLNFLGLLTNAERVLLMKVTLSVIPVHISIATCLSDWAVKQIDRQVQGCMAQCLQPDMLWGRGEVHTPWFHDRHSPPNTRPQDPADGRQWAAALLSRSVTVRTSLMVEKSKSWSIMIFEK